MRKKELHKYRQDSDIESDQSNNIQEKLNLYKKMQSGSASAHDLVRLSFLTGMINADRYADFLKIEKEYGKDFSSSY